MIAPPFCVGVTRDLLTPGGTEPVADIRLDPLDSNEIEWAFLSDDVDELSPQLIDGFDAVFVGGPSVAARSIVGNERLALLARFGVGYEKIDVDACTQSGILVTITPDAVRRPVAVAALTLLLSLSQNLRSVDHLTRGGRWQERANFLGVGLVGRTIGAVGLGNIGQELFRLIEHFGMRRFAYDPYIDAASARAVGAELVELDVLCRESDFIVVMCALTPQTHHLLDAKRLALIKESALLVNVARGAVIENLWVPETRTGSAMQWLVGRRCRTVGCRVSGRGAGFAGGCRFAYVLGASAAAGAACAADALPAREGDRDSRAAPPAAGAGTPGCPSAASRE